jgi:hypothetical protein
LASVLGRMGFTAPTRSSLFAFFTNRASCVLASVRFSRLLEKFADYKLFYWVEIVSTTVSQGERFLKPPLPITFTHKA